MQLDRQFPCVRDMQIAAQKRLPKFSYDYLRGGIGGWHALVNNRTALDAVTIIPRYLPARAQSPDCQQTIFGQQYAYPFGVAPIGLGGLIWPGAAEALAAAAHATNIPFCLSCYATADLESIAAIGGEHCWYQHYPCAKRAHDKALIQRAADSGYTTLVVTVDIPVAARREHDLRNGLAVPPTANLRTIYEIARHPRWARAMLQFGLPTFRNMTDFIPPMANIEQFGIFIQEMIVGPVTLDHLRWIRDYWPHRLLVKGILDGDDARACQQMGIDGLVLSNHGGRQLDAAPSALEVLPRLRAMLGDRMVLCVDGGVTSGLDVVRCLGLGADFVLAGRAFMYGVAGLGAAGAAHVMKVLSEEFRTTMIQIGARNVRELPQFCTLPRAAITDP